MVDTGTALAGLRSAVDDALGWDLHSCTDQEIVELLVHSDVERNRAEAAQRRVIAEFENRHLAGELGSRSTADAMVELLRVSRWEANERVKAARTYGPGRALTGEVLEPVVPLVAEALESGKVSLAHANVIVKVLDKLPGDIEAAFGRQAQEFLLEQASIVEPVTLGKIAVRLRDTLDQDGAIDRSRTKQQHRGFYIDKRSDGWGVPRGLLNPALTTALQTMLDPLSAPRPSELGEKDPRNLGERQHDALFEGTKLVIKSGNLPGSGGVASPQPCSSPSPRRNFASRRA